jgi:amidase
MTTPSWQDTASQKREAIFAAIPSEWRIEKLPSVEEQVDVTEYIKQYLEKEELAITQSSADFIAKTVAEGGWKAEDVARAFCHRAALAHQLVRQHTYMINTHLI